MSLSWTSEMKRIAQEENKALVKLQTQFKHCGGGNYRIVGPFPAEQATALTRSVVLSYDKLVDLVDDILQLVDGKCLDDCTDRNDVAICIVEELLGRRP